DNAVKWSPDGAAIELWTTRDEERRSICVHVRDYGPGIAQEVLPHVFERFVTGDPSRKESHGLGLSIVYDVIRQHQGCVWIENADSAGTVVSMRLPCVDKNVPDADAKQVRG
ncbi:MAG: sensor histidine kinase, partial [Firmicutes bacterium]|nr:sensor histidine kinase [Bacillota bacterium]